MNNADVPSHTYQLASESWTGWNNFYAGSAEILEYWKRVAAKHDVRKRIRFEHQCIGARWSETAQKWTVQVQDLRTGHRKEDTADVLMTGEGVLNEWKWPEIDGLLSFQGQLLHSAAWDKSFDPAGRRVAVIGAGSSGIQIVPALEPHVAHMDHYVRGRTWISSLYGSAEVEKRTGDASGDASNFAYTEAEKAAWAADREKYIAYRKTLEMQMQSRIGYTLSGSREQEAAKKEFRANMEAKLAGKPELARFIVPDFSPLCKRLTPGPGYLEALASPKVDVLTTGIRRVDATGIITDDGVHHPVDAIVCATGFQTSPGTSKFPILGRGGANLRERYARNPETYLGLCTDGFPNFFQSLGPNAFQGSGNLLVMIEATHRYVAQVLEKLATGNVATVEPRRRCVDLFTRHCDEYFKRTVYSESCDSWYKSSPPGATREQKRNGRVTAIWPGSSLHAIHVLRTPRWEDYEMRAYDDNEFGWFGNGLVAAELEPSDAAIDKFTYYLDDTSILA